MEVTIPPHPSALIAVASPATLTPALSDPALAPVIAQAKHFFQCSTAPQTRESYARDWQAFQEWCADHNLISLPATPETTACYLTGLALRGLKINTMTRHLAAIGAAHQQAGFTSPSRDPVVRQVLGGIRRTQGTPPQGVEALSTADLQRMLSVLPATLCGQRDRAILLVGFAGAFRRSELVALDVEDVQFREEGLAILLRRSKTDQQGKGRWVGLPAGTQADTCPVQALQQWLTDAEITTGAIFRGVNRHGQLASARLSTRAVADLIKRAARAAGLDPTRYSGHSLRAGHCTTAARAGASEHMIMRQTGHRSTAMVQRYIRQGSLFQDNSAALLGL